MTEKILCVDDEQNVLDAFQRQLRKHFRIDTALGGEEALATIGAGGPYAVVVSDMRMPGMDGVQLLATVKKRAPESVRIMLTGNSDQQTAMEAVNEGSIFRFLTKPCPLETLAKALTAGIEQYRLVTAERELLGKTLRGSIKVLNDVLSLTNPTAFGHASRSRRLVGQLCKELNVERAWEVEVAAMLSQIGCVTIPPDTLEKIYHHKTLTREETEMFESHPAAGRDLVVNIPRLEGVAEIITYQQKRFDGTGTPSDSVAGTKIPLGARLLKVALDYNMLKWTGRTEIDVTVELRKRLGWYDPEILKALEAVIGIEEAIEIQEVKLKDLTTSMTLADDVTTEDGTMLVGKGQEVTSSVCQRLGNFGRKRKIKEPIRVLVRSDVRSPVTTRT